jgi:hypothetical protein
MRKQTVKNIASRLITAVHFNDASANGIHYKVNQEELTIEFLLPFNQKDRYQNNEVHANIKQLSWV